MRAMELFVKIVTIVLVCLVCFLFGKSFSDDTQYKCEIITVEKNDTVWNYWCEGYYNGLTYNEALYIFKLDNNRESCELSEGEMIILRKVVN